MGEELFSKSSSPKNRVLASPEREKGVGAPFLAGAIALSAYSV